ncbi:hypothetical protein [Escherichia coli]|uniref:hypothetical protein n=1 Tax=Escherichia coli TaxID=562 RepID=UPI001F385506|nr:hypothetical protein [Escherichia coli]
MQKYRLELWTKWCCWEAWGLFDTHEAARVEGLELVRCWSGAFDFKVTPVQIPDKVEEMKYDIDNGACFKENLADSMDQSCHEIHAHGFPADDPKAKREYEKAAKDFCIDNLSAFDK